VGGARAGRDGPAVGRARRGRARLRAGADRRWIGGRQYDPEPGDYVAGEGLAEVAIDVVINVVSDLSTD
jgi:hypothetical protein